MSDGKEALKERPLAPHESCSWLSMLTFGFCNPTLREGYARVLTIDDIWPLGADVSCEGGQVDRLCRCWAEEQEKESPSLFRAILRSNRAELLRQMCTSVVWAALVVVGPAWFLPNILLFLQDPTWVVYVGWVLVASLFLCQALVSVVAAQMLWRNSVLAIAVRSSLTALVVSKLTRLASPGKVAANVLNVCSNDLQRVFMMFMFTPILAGGVFGVIGVCIALVARFDAAGAPPAAVLLLSFLVNQSLSRVASVYSQRVLPLTDARVKLMSHIVRAIMVVKLFAWEELLAGRVADVRRRELVQREKAASVAAVLEAVALSTILLASLLFVLTFSLLGRPFIASDIFTGLSLVIIGRIPLIQVQLFAQFAGEARSSYPRIEHVLALPSLPESATAAQQNLFGDQDNAMVEAEAAVFAPGEQVTDFSLSDVSFRVGPGESLCVVGPVGSGKSTLLLGVIQAMQPISGRLSTLGNCAFVPQEQFLVNATLRDNILFGSPMDQERYDKVIHWCCLAHDLLQLVDGDMTEIGSFGINISGGQKARVAIARAAYAPGRQVLVLDDPFSALDAHVGRTVFERLTRAAREEKKILVMSTHQLHLAQECTRVVCLSGGRQQEYGTFDELMHKQEGAVFRLLMEQYSDEQQKQQDDDDILTLERKRPMAVSSSQATSTTAAVSAASTVSGGVSKYALVKKEESQTGSVGFYVWKEWLKGLSVMSFGVLALALLAFGTQGFMDFFISYWVNNTLNLSSSTYLWIYAVLTVFCLCCYVLYLLCYWPLALRSSQQLHNRAFRRVLHATMAWFESVPSGRVLNRFAKDVDVVDQALPDAFKVFFGNLLQLIMFAVVISVAFTWFLIAVFPVFLLFLIVTLYFNRTNRQIRRLEALVRSPVFSEISTLLSGLQTLRVYGQTEEFARRLLHRNDVFSSSVFMFWSMSRWLALRLDLTCAVVVLIASVIAVSLRGTGVPPSYAAIAITYSLRMGSFLQWTFRNLSLMESAAVSAERILEYASDVPVEPSGGATVLPEEWPSRGDIVFENVSMRYAAELPQSLKSLDLRVRGGEHVGVVGRTGAGKSTLASILFRLRELETGSIRIDGVDISLLSLKVLRSRLSIITQESVLFQGTLRFNLDPFDQHSNEELWAVVERVGLKELVESNGGLEFAVEDGGSNLSAGERQVLCLARIMLHPSKVVVLDEATSNVDAGFDAIIQTVVRKEFKRSTIICIAHRLHSIIDSDRILLLDKGEAIEYDRPAALVQRPSLFRDLLLDTGIESSRALIKAASTVATRLDEAIGEKEEVDASNYYQVFEHDFDVTERDLVGP